MNCDLIRVLQLRITKACFCLILLALATGFIGCSRGDAKSEEKRILSEINRVTEQSDRQIRSDDMWGPLRRLNELRPFFPERRDEINREAQAVKAAFSQVLKDDEKVAELWQELLRQPLSDAYRKCVTSQIEIGELTSAKSQRVIDEMDVLLDPAINNKQNLDAKVNSLRSDSDELNQRLREREMYLDQNCRRPSSDNRQQ
jgi:hypothetical protein